MKIKIATLVFTATAWMNLPVFAGEFLNDDFETVVKAPRAMVQSMRDNLWTFEEPVQVPAHWTVNAFMKRGEYKLIEDPSLCHSGAKCVYIKGDLKYDKLFKVSKEDMFEIRFWAKSDGKVLGCVYLYNADVGFLGEIDVKQPGNGQWMEYKMNFALPETGKNGDLVANAVVALRSESGAYFGDVSIIFTPKQ